MPLTTWEGDTRLKVPGMRGRRKASCTSSIAGAVLNDETIPIVNDRQDGDDIVVIPDNEENRSDCSDQLKVKQSTTDYADVRNKERQLKKWEESLKLERARLDVELKDNARLRTYVIRLKTKVKDLESTNTILRMENVTLADAISSDNPTRDGQVGTPRGHVNQDHTTPVSPGSSPPKGVDDLRCSSRGHTCARVGLAHPDLAREATCKAMENRLATMENTDMLYRIQRLEESREISQRLHSREMVYIFRRI